MRNPFDDLLRKSRQNQRRIAVQRDEQQRAAALAQERTELRRQIKQRYHAMVTGLLEQLIRSVNPDFELNVSDWGWSVGRWTQQPEDKSLRWQSFLDVQLIFEMNDTPLYFEVTRHRKTVRAGLGEDELALVLRALYPG
ncbi:MAG: hypothetical protein MUC85_05290 [Anaerolineales bacterium]|jgi:hypothetical protein|nr:hypothetical protein [Anaerolineales bacterium]